MGDGIFIARQIDPTAKRCKLQNVVLMREDLEAMRDAGGALDVTLKEGKAVHMGEGCYVVLQSDCTAPAKPIQSVVLAANDVSAMLAAAA